MLFGAGDATDANVPKVEESKDALEGNADQLMDMLGVTLDDDADKKPEASAIDDAIVIEDDAIIVE